MPVMFVVGLRFMHTSACGRSKRRKCVCECRGELHGNLVPKEPLICPDCTRDITNEVVKYKCHTCKATGVSTTYGSSSRFSYSPRK
jgi:hypothetical protein